MFTVTLCKINSNQFLAIENYEKKMHFIVQLCEIIAVEQYDTFSVSGESPLWPGFPEINTVTVVDFIVLWLNPRNCKL